METMLNLFKGSASTPSAASNSAPASKQQQQDVSKELKEDMRIERNLNQSSTPSTSTGKMFSGTQATAPQPLPTFGASYSSCVSGYSILMLSIIVYLLMIHVSQVSCAEIKLGPSHPAPLDADDQAQHWKSRVHYCTYFNKSECHKEREEDCYDQKLCYGNKDGSDPLCYSLWKNVTNGSVNKIELHLMGCWVSDGIACNTPRHKECYESRAAPAKNLFYCCCNTNVCNKNYYYKPEPQTLATEGVSSPPARVERKDKSFGVLHMVLSICVASVFIGSAFYGAWYFRNRKLPRFNSLPTAEDGLQINESQYPTITFGPIHSLEEKAKGKYGSVYKARVGNDPNDERIIAVKIFRLENRTSWNQEYEIYRLPQMRHENILCFLGAEKRAEPHIPFATEYWLVTEYHELGSLYDYLKSHEVSYDEMLKIALGISRGLAHLHEELPPTRSESLKPTVAHRDFKSKNVLLKPDLTACIADFGMAIVYYPNEAPNESLGQVGTWRYMAPEVLEGAISFSRDALLRIDMYACGLVMWELMTRLKLNPDHMVPMYQLPFEEELINYPPPPQPMSDREKLQDIITRKNEMVKYTVIKEEWRSSHPNTPMGDGLKLVCDTIGELWETEPEARLSASCVEERLTTLISGGTGNNYFNYLRGSNTTETNHLVPSSAYIINSSPPYTNHTSAVNSYNQQQFIQPQIMPLIINHQQPHPHNPHA